MKKPTVIAHHGSPGHPSDFKAVSENLFPQMEWKTIDRYANPYQTVTDVLDGKTENIIIIGYSFGCTRAIQDATLLLKNNIRPSAVILVSPYLFIKNSPSSMTRFALNLPVLSDVLLKNKGEKAIENMLETSSYPKPVPGSYRAQKGIYTNANVLRQSVLEKEHDTLDFKPLKESAVPVTIIYGSQDKTSNRQEQITPIQNLLGGELVEIADGGHALLWTHAHQVEGLIRDTVLKATGKIGYYPGESEENNVFTFLKGHLKNFPTRKILTWVDLEVLKNWDFNLNTPLPHRSVSVQELNHLIGVVGTGLSKLGIQKGDRVIVFIPMSLYLYTTMFALQKIGAIPVFLDSWARRDQLGISAEQASPKAIVSVERAFVYLGEVPEIRKIPLKVVAGPAQGNYSARLEELMQEKSYCPVAAVEKEHTALITFTTGSSGTPKGADRTHRFLAAQHYALNRHLPYVEGDVDLPVFPIFSLNNLAAGVNTVIPAIDVGTPSDRDSLILMAQMKSQKVTCVTLSPGLLNGLSKYCLENNYTLPELRRIITGGAPVSRDDTKRIKAVCPNAEILILYGSTEVEPMGHIEAKEMLNLKTRADEDAEWVDEGVNVGHMDEGLQTKFIKITKESITIARHEDWKKYEVVHGEVGEIIVAGEHVCHGYFNNPEAFARAKIRGHDGTIWHRTGDLGRIDEKGYLWLVGRVHNAINRGGRYYFPVRAEIIMKKIPQVKYAAYLGMPDATLGEKTFAVVALNEPADVSSKGDSIKQEIARLLDKNGVAFDQIRIVEKIPMDPRHHSKVEYEVLRQELLKG
ncbi:MAG: AMP-binding protein [Bdellovibrio sp.]|nr:AMP-binding protein [Bdellovibrio sp.]